MDKSDLLEEWDVVTVASVYETEKENTENDAKIDVNDVKDKDSNIDSDGNTVTGSANVERETVAESRSKVSESSITSEPKIEIETKANLTSQPGQNSDTEPKRDIDTEPKKYIEVESKFETNVVAEHENSPAASESMNIAAVKSQSSIVTQSESSVITDVAADTKTEIEINKDVYAEEKANVDIDHGPDAPQENADDENVVEDIVHVDNPVNNNLDSSGMTFGTESFEEFDIQSTPEIVPDRIKIEQEMASIESSSSDIDIIDENVEESITGSFISPLSLSISSSVADTSSIHSFSSQSEDKCNQDGMSDQKTKGTEKGKNTKRSESTEKTEFKHNVPPEKTCHGDKKENVHKRKSESQRTTNHRSFFDWFALLIELFRNMSGYDWCLVGGVAVSLYLTVVINQTNIFAVVQKDNVVSQMKDMIEELKNDNKMIKEQMLSELKNEKALSSFEHQIRELRKENSKLNHILYGVAKVLDKQKNSHEKKDDEYQAPFKKEINKLKEHINILKFDNEELQKQLVRMRYGSFAQGGTEAPEQKDQSRNKQSTQADDLSAEEIRLDIESLKKWNELITLLNEELSASIRSEGFKDEKSDSETQNENSKPFWKALFTDFKGTVNELRKLNFTTVLSNYKKANEKAVSDIYKSVKDFFTVAEHAQQYTSKEDDSQWKNIGDFVSDLKGKWTSIKDRLYTSDLKKFFQKHLKKTTGESTDGESNSQKPDDTEPKYTESGTTSTHFKPEEKHDKVQTPEEDKWMFKRAAHREELRNEDEDEVNWFLKKGKHNPEEEKEKKHF